MTPSTAERPLLLDLSELRWRPFRRALLEALQSLATEPAGWFSLRTNPGLPAGCKAILTFRTDEQGLHFEHEGIRHSGDSPADLAALVEEVLDSLDIVRPEQVNVAFPRRIDVCSASFWSDSHCPSGGPDSYDRDQLRRHVERAAIGWLGYAPHVDHDGDRVIHGDLATTYLICDPHDAVVTIWASLPRPHPSEAALASVNDANSRHPFAKFVLRDDDISVVTVVDCWEFSSYNFGRVLKCFLEAVQFELSTEQHGARPS